MVNGKAIAALKELKPFKDGLHQGMKERRNARRGSGSSAKSAFSQRLSTSNSVAHEAAMYGCKPMQGIDFNGKGINMATKEEKAAKRAAQVERDRLMDEKLQRDFYDLSLIHI